MPKAVVRRSPIDQVLRVNDAHRPAISGGVAEVRPVGDPAVDDGYADVVTIESVGLRDVGVDGLQLVVERQLSRGTQRCLDGAIRRDVGDIRIVRQLGERVGWDGVYGSIHQPKRAQMASASAHHGVDMPWQRGLLVSNDDVHYGLGVPGGEVWRDPAALPETQTRGRQEHHQNHEVLLGHIANFWASRFPLASVVE